MSSLSQTLRNCFFQCVMSSNHPSFQVQKSANNKKRWHQQSALVCSPRSQIVGTQMNGSLCSCGLSQPNIIILLLSKLPPGVFIFLGHGQKGKNGANVDDDAQKHSFFSFPLMLQLISSSFSSSLSYFCFWPLTRPKVSQLNKASGKKENHYLLTNKSMSHV